jgi:phosphoglycolate phosphatase
MSAFKLVVFDYDGTLFDTRPAIVHCLQRAFEDCGRAVPAREAVAGAVGAGLPLQDTLLLLNPRLRHDRIALEELVVTYRRLYRDEAAPLLRPFPGAMDTLRQLHEGGVKCAVVSNKGIDAVRRSLDESGLSAFIDLVLAEQPGVPNKPDPAVVSQLILPHFPQLPRTQMLIVGDTETDILFARRASLACCWASYGYGDAQRCRTLAPVYEIGSITELLALVVETAPCTALG